MHRIQVQLTAEQERVLRDVARLRGCSISALIREGVDTVIAPESERRKQSHKRAMELVGALSDEADVARRHDDYLAAETAPPGRRA